MIDVQAIAHHYGGKVCNGNALIPTPGHSPRDRGTSIRASLSSPDGVVVHCFNGSTADALAVKEMLLSDGHISADRAGNSRKLTASERRSIRKAERAMQNDRLVKQEVAASNAKVLWTEASETSTGHPYLVKKGLEPIGIRQNGDALIVPMVDTDFRLWNVQRIRPDGFKLFAKGARTKGLFWPSGGWPQDAKETVAPLVIGEGYATMAAIHLATGLGVAAAMSARNLEPVAIALRKEFPEREIIIAADDDWHLPDNLGLNAAKKAAESVGAVLAIPQPKSPETRSGDSGTDFADISRDDVAASINAARQGE